MFLSAHRSWNQHVRKAEDREKAVETVADLTRSTLQVLFTLDTDNSELFPSFEKLGVGSFVSSIVQLRAPIYRSCLTL